MKRIVFAVILLLASSGMAQDQERIISDGRSRMVNETDYKHIVVYGIPCKNEPSNYLFTLTSSSIKIENKAGITINLGEILSSIHYALYNSKGKWSGVMATKIIITRE